MSTILLFKLLLVPTLIAGITLAGRRWGPAVAGWLSAFPVVAGPILFFIAMEQGATFAADAAVGTLSALPAIVAFGLGYAWKARRFAWAGSLVSAFAAYLIGVAAVVMQAFTRLTLQRPTAARGLIASHKLAPPPHPGPHPHIRSKNRCKGGRTARGEGYFPAGKTPEIRLVE